MFKIQDIISINNGFTDTEISAFSAAVCDSPKYYRSSGILELHLSNNQLLPLSSVIKLKKFFVENMNADLSLQVFVNKEITEDEKREKILEIAENLDAIDLFSSALFVFKEDIEIQFSNIPLRNKAMDLLDTLQKDYDLVGGKETIVCTLKNRAPRTYNPDSLYTKVTLDMLKMPKNKILVEAGIFKIDEPVISNRRFNNDKVAITYYLNDHRDVACAKLFVDRNNVESQLGKFKTGSWISLKGDAKKNIQTQEMEILVEQMEAIPTPIYRQDNAPRKRIELHTHTKMSEMDGVSSPTELLTQAYNFGMEAMAITDHMVVQEFPEIQKTAGSLAKKDENRPFKAIYGIEMNMVESKLDITRNTDETSLDKEYVVFDLETTGLSNQYDHIIEFGGVKMRDGLITDRLQLFVKPPIKLPEFTKNLTNIKDSDVENADPIEIVLPKIMDFFGDDILVAQNAQFDIGFINSKLQLTGKNKLTNPVVDTLNLARVLNKERKSYRLGKIASFYKIDYDDDVAHRADYDAEVTALVFEKMLDVCKQNYDVKTIADLQNLSDKDAFKKANKKHVTLLAKNQDGIKDMFKLVSLSHTDYLVFGGKVSTKNDEFIAEPRILRECIQEMRSNLLVGSACCNGEIFEIASNYSRDELLEAMKFYDYIEVQPLENYRFLVENHSIQDNDRLITIVKDIISCAKELKIPVVATGDVHYTNPDEKIFRDVYINAQGIGGNVHPLYIYNEAIRKKTINPDQHLRTTEEMLECFCFLDEKTREEIVIDNTHLIADQIEVCKPCKDRLYPPSIEGADDKLKEICYRNAYERYGNPLPEIVSARLERELTSIIKNGYGVIYYTAHLMVKDSNDHDYMVGSRGSVGSSFVATMADITEVNPLEPHYLCPNCKHSEWGIDGCESGFDLPDKLCPVCGATMKPNGQNIPFETFLGFYGDKVPDIDLNFSGDYQGQAMLYTKVVFGEDKVFRAGTISGVQEKTAYGYIRGYQEKMGIENQLSNAQRIYMAMGCADTKRTTGQHPGGIIVIPKDMDVHDFTPVQYPANNPESEWKTTHMQFADIHDNVLKLDNLGHVDPTCMRLLEKVSGIDVRQIPMNDAKVISIFNSPKALNIKDKNYKEKTGALGLPEFGTRFVRGILADTKPDKYSLLVRISGLSHGTDVWANNAKDLVAAGKTLNDVIGCRDDIMTHLISCGLDAKSSFDIMESVRKGRGLKPEWMELMRANNVPEWYIESCLKIKYMFPKGHAVAYVTMAVRIAWFKVYYPLYYYISFFTLRCDAYEITTMVKGAQAVKTRLDEINSRINSKEWDIRKSVTKKDNDLVTTFEVCSEMYARGYGISNISLELSDVKEFVLDPNNKNNLIPPFVTIDGLGYNVAKSIVDAREKQAFISKQDLISRTQLSKTLVDKLSDMGVLDHLQEENQMSLF